MTRMTLIKQRLLNHQAGDLGSFFECFDGFEHVIHMPRDLQAAPLFFQQAISTDQECAALNAFDFFAVHDLVLDDAEHVAHLFFSIGQ